MSMSSTISNYISGTKILEVASEDNKGYVYICVCIIVETTYFVKLIYILLQGVLDFV